jgi:hypothetical protein
MEPTINMVAFARNVVCNHRTNYMNTCTVCLAEMELSETCGHDAPVPSYGCEPDWIVDEEKYECPECGHYEWRKV